MFIKLNPTKIDHTVARLGRNGITVPLEAVVDVTASGVRLRGIADEDTLTAVGVVTVTKNCAAVELNPVATELLGYQPGGPTYLHPGQFGELEFKCFKELTAGQREKLDSLPWLVELHLVPVTYLPE